jgi:hypothetical protein
MFFRPTKAPLKEISPNARRERSSTYMSDERFKNIKQSILIQPHHRSQSIDLTERPYPQLNQPAVSSGRFSPSRGRTPSTHPLRTAPNTTSKLSENTTTAVTWSETQVSPGATAVSRRRNHDHQHHRSPTPEPIRRSIESTGIFRHTGIERTPGLMYSDRSATSQSNLATRHSRLSTSDQQSEGRDQTPRQQRDVSIAKGAANEILSEKERENRPVGMEDSATAKRGQVIVEHYDPNIGGHRQQDQLEEKSAAAPVEVELLRQSKSTSLTREQIAKDARIKRPASTKPVETGSGESMLYDGKNNRLSQPANTSENIAGNQNLIDTMEHLLQPLSVETSDPTGEPLCHPSSKNFMVKHPGTDAPGPYKSENRLPLEHFQPDSLPPQFGRWLDGLSREGVPDSVRQSDTSRLGPEYFDSAAIAGLPVRGPSRSRFAQPPPRPLRLPPEVEPVSLYLNQIRRQFTPERQILEDNSYNHQADDSRNVFSPEMVRYLEGNEYDILEEQDFEPGRLVEPLIDEEEDDLEYYAGHHTIHGQTWQPIAEGDDETMESYQGSRIAYEEQLVEDVLMPGFWRRNRPF